MEILPCESTHQISAEGCNAGAVGSHGAVAGLLLKKIFCISSCNIRESSCYCDYTDLPFAAAVDGEPVDAAPGIFFGLLFSISAKVHVQQYYH